MKRTLSLLLCALLISTAFALFGPNIVVTDASAELVEGEGNCFEITNSTYLNVTLCSSEVVNVTLESIPKVVSFTIHNVTSAQTTEITISGFEPNKTYYRHEDGHLMENFVADQDGNYSYTQDLSWPHHVFVQEEAGTKYVKDDATGGDCTSIGTWDSGAKTCTLTSDVYETIVIDADGLKLDGGGHSVTKLGGSYGIYASYRSGVTITNVVVSGFAKGIYPGLSGGNNTITGNRVSGAFCGIELGGSGNNTISGNNVSGSHRGINVYSSNNTISGNNVSNNGYSGIYLTSGGNNTISGNNVSGNGRGIYLDSSGSNNMFRGNAISRNAYNFGVLGSSLSHFIQDIDTSNTVDGKPIYYVINRHNESAPSDAGYVGMINSSHMTVQGLTLTNNLQGMLFAFTSDSTTQNVDVSGNDVGIHLISSSASVITGNNVSGNGIGIYLDSSSASVITGNNVSGNGDGILLGRSNNNTVGGNNVSSNGGGIRLHSSNNNIFGGNNVSGNGNGFHVYDSGSNTISRNAISGNDHGIYLYGSGSNTISGNNVSGNSEGIRLYSSDSSTISGNDISYNSYGIYLGGSDNTISGNDISYNGRSGIYLGGSDNTISGNDISYNGRSGIYLGGSSRNTISGNNLLRTHYGIHLYHSPHNTISGNTISGNSEGIRMLSSSYLNTISGNTVSNNNYGILVAYSGGNSIFHNNLVDNTIQIRSTSAINYWDNGDGEGNYWSDYTGLDDGSGEGVAGDGVGDTLLPHQGVDWYPLMSPWSANTAPEICSFTATPSVEGTAIVFTVYANDGENDPLTYSFDFDSDGVIDQTGSSNTASFTWYDDYTGTATVEVSDGEYTVEATAPVSVTNVPPDVLITGPAAGSLYPVNTPVEFTGTFTDVGIEDTHTAEWRFESELTIEAPGTVTESGGSGTVTDIYTFAAAGVYMVTLTVTDDDGGIGTANTIGDLNAMVVIYDPSEGFVTGGGWYWSSPGGYIRDPGLEGKVSFGFVAKYHKGADVPKGNTEFRFKAAGMDFHSTSYDWLVIAGPKAKFKGTGTINGEGDYAFMLTVIDGDLPGGDGVDKIRMKIWDKGTGIMVYDTNVGTDDNTDPLTPLGGGEIKIHKG